jgi:hypothetical protein
MPMSESTIDYRAEFQKTYGKDPSDEELRIFIKYLTLVRYYRTIDARANIV